jgi:hypothetical protein
MVTLFLCLVAFGIAFAILYIIAGLLHMTGRTLRWGWRVIRR